jgi:glycosyltransferase involved in cell wall biosynthesis
MKKNKHKVLFRYSSHQLDTGSPKALLATIALLSDTSYQASYLATGNGPLVDELEKRKVPIIKDSVEEISLRKPIRAFQRVMYWRRKLKKENYSLVHMNEFGWSQDIVIAARTLKIPVVLHCHNPTNIHFNNLNRFAASKILTVSKNHLNDIENVHRIKHKCDVLYNTINPEEFASGHSIRSELNIAKDEIVIGTIAQICHRKGVDIFVDCAKKLMEKHHNLRFIVIGPPGKGENSYVQEINDSLNNTTFGHKINFLGSRDDIPDLLATMDIFSLPTRAEPFGMVITEAMAASIPVVASEVGGIPEILSSPKYGFLVKTIDSEHFYKVINSILKSKDLGKDIGICGKNSLIGRFDEASIKRKIVEVYDELLSE